MKQLPLRHFPFYATRDPDVVRNTLAKYGITNYDVIGDASTYEKKVNFVALKNISLYYGVCSTGVRMTASAVGMVRPQICFAGSGRTVSGGVARDLDRRDWSAVIPSGETALFDFAPGYGELRMAIDEGIIKRKLGALIGDAPVDHIAFTPDNNVPSPELARFRRLLSFLLSELDAGGPQQPGIFINEIAEAMLVSYLCGQEHNYSQRLFRPELAPSSLQLRAVEDYIAAHLNEMLSIEDIVKATNVSARSIFRSFKATHGCSPFQYVKRMRLEQARTMLLRKESPSVISVALKCGFQSFGHFANDYRAAYGELPSQTARR